MKKATDRLGDFLFRSPEGRGILAVLLLALFLAGYSTTSRVVSQCHAQWPITSDTFLGSQSNPAIQNTVCPPCTAVTWPSPCDFSGQAVLTKMRIAEALESDMQEAAAELQSYIGNWLVDGMMTAFLEQIDQAELNLIDWWSTFWFYNLRPAMQDMTKQLSVSMADEVRMMMAAADGQGGNAAKRAREKMALEDIAIYRPSEGAAVVATLIGGQNRSLALGNAVRQAVQDETLAAGANHEDSPVATGTARVINTKNALYERLFCDPDDNGGKNNCDAADPRYYNADTQITRHIYNRLTLDIESAP